ncbi:MAG: DUF2635 domain-containing protein [Myxococcales bacterium]|jgi:hypothetical protein|nr:DUF2635 domain-containing protein [Myxococcales bacterium]
MPKRDSAILRPEPPTLVIIDPETGRPLAKEGERKPLNSFWRRRLAAKAVVEVIEKPKLEAKEEPQAIVQAEEVPAPEPTQAQGPVADEEEIEAADEAAEPSNQEAEKGEEET